MNKNEKFVIAINREMGSGGRTIGRKLAEKLGVEFYYKSVIKGLEKKFNLTAEEVERQKGRQQGWWADIKRQFLNMHVSSSPAFPMVTNEADMLDTDEIFKAETEILKGIAEEESCVIAGRSGFYVFRDHPNHMNVLIQASMPYRVARVANKQGLTEEEARKAIDKVDKMRENYVNKYTKSSRYDTRNYQLVISMDNMSEDDAVALIMDYINRQSKK